MKQFTRLFMLTAFLFAGIGVHAQTQTQNNLTVEELVNEFLLGEGVEAFNITYNGAPGNQIVPRVGTFLSEDTGFPIEEGMVMTTKNVQIVTCGGMTGGSGAGNDPDLSQIVGGTAVHDVTVVEFDFIPSGDSINFDFIFASREYNAFVCSQYNDVFGFFLSGPGITGPFSNLSANIAQLPDGTAVTINNVNNGGTFGPCENPQTGEMCPCNSEFFVDQGDDVGDGSQSDVCFGGYTVPLTARAEVICGEVYHIKLAIANVFDGIRDSGVFFEKGSFSSNLTVSLDLNPVLPGFEIGDEDFSDGVVAGCTNLEFCLFRPDTAGVDTAFFAIGGSAIEGIQYIAPENNYVVFPPGVDTVCTELITIANNLGSQIDSLTILAFALDPCTGDTVTITASIPVYNEYSYPVVTTDVTITCPQEFVNLTGSASGGLSPYTYEWFLPDSTTSIGEGTTVPVEPPDMGETATYLLMVTDACGLSPEYASITVTSDVVPPPSPSITADPDTVHCIGDTSDLLATTEFGQGDLSYSWGHGGSETTTTVMPDGTQTTTWYYIFVTDECQLMGTDSIPVYFIPLDNPVAIAGDDVEVLCAGDEVVLSGSAEGGAQPYVFQWQTSPEPGAEYTVNPMVTTSYFLQVTDDCGGTSELAEVQVIVPEYDPITIELAELTSDCPGDEQTLFADVEGGAGGFTYEWSGGTVPLENAPTVTVSPLFGTFYTVVVTDICGAQGSGSTLVDVVVPAPIEATATARPVCSGEVINLNVSNVEGGAGDVSDFIFSWFGPGIDLGEGSTTDGSYTVSTGGFSGEEELVYIVTIIDVCGNPGEAVAQTNFADVGDIPNVITPNNDGINDQFIIANSSIFNTNLTIMDRWGKVVFESENYVCDRALLNDPSTLINQNCWTAQDEKGDTYYYLIDIDNGLCTYQGVVHVLDNQ